MLTDLIPHFPPNCRRTECIYFGSLVSVRVCVYRSDSQNLSLEI